jgi:hypothetical protein
MKKEYQYPKTETVAGSYQPAKGISRVSETKKHQKTSCLAPTL